MNKEQRDAHAAMVEAWSELGLGADELVECLHCGQRFTSKAEAVFDGYVLRCPTSGCDGSSCDWFPAAVLDGSLAAERRMNRAQLRALRRSGVVARRLN